MVFCPDYDDASNPILGVTPTLYCSRTCSKAAHRKRRHDRETRIRAAAEARKVEERSRRTCARKRPYPSEGVALWMIANWVASDVDRSPPAAAYECPSCGRWHLTSWQGEHGPAAGRYVPAPAPVST